MVAVAVNLVEACLGECSLLLVVGSHWQSASALFGIFVECFFFWIFCGLIFDGWVQVIGFDSLWAVGGLSCGGFAGCWD